MNNPTSFIDPFGLFEPGIIYSNSDCGIGEDAAACPTPTPVSESLEDYELQMMQRWGVAWALSGMIRRWFGRGGGGGSAASAARQTPQAPAQVARCAANLANTMSVAHYAHLQNVRRPPRPSSPRRFPSDLRRETSPTSGQKTPELGTRRAGPKSHRGHTLETGAIASGCGAHTRTLSGLGRNARPASLGHCSAQTYTAPA